MSLSDWADVSTIATGLVAVAALAGAVWQVFVGRRSQRESTAYELYAGYLACAVEHPKFASAYVPLPADVGNPKPREFNEEFERYEWFVSVMLQAFEQILDLTRGDEIWKGAIVDQIGYHHKYLASSRFIARHYSPELRALFPQQ